nr:TIGR02117 family protein [Comamonas testosteroni]
MLTTLKRVLGVLLALVVVGWLILTFQPRTAERADAKGNVEVHVVGNGWHAGLLLPAQAINARLPTLRQRFPGAGYYEIGWGDVGFYRAKSITAGLAVQAMFASQGSVMHVVGVPNVQQFLRGSDTASLCISNDAYQRLATMVADSFARQGGEPVDAGPGIYGNSQFYIAEGSYSALHTCNRWTAAVLQAAGVSISPRISLTASSVLGAARGSALACSPK